VLIYQESDQIGLSNKQSNGARVTLGETDASADRKRGTWRYKDTSQQVVMSADASTACRGLLEGSG
jgi:hypothetical protein